MGEGGNSRGRMRAILICILGMGAGEEVYWGESRRKGKTEKERQLGRKLQLTLAFKIRGLLRSEGSGRQEGGHGGEQTWKREHLHSQIVGEGGRLSLQTSAVGGRIVLLLSPAGKIGGGRK